MREDDVARLASEIALTYPGATGDGGLHALDRDRTLCGLTGDSVERQDEPFSPLGPSSCPACAEAFTTLAGIVPTLELADSWKDMRPRSGYHNQLKQQFANELDAEVSLDHPLAGAAAYVVVANAEDDVVIVRTDGRVAVVRLTWSRETETPPKPHVAFVDGRVPPASELALDA